MRTTGEPAFDSHFFVPLYVEQSPDLYITQLAILKAGGAFCPIALDAPEERLRFILQDVNADILLTTSRLKPRLPTLDKVRVMCVDGDIDVTSPQDSSARIDPSQPAYIMYVDTHRGQFEHMLISSDYIGTQVAAPASRKV